MSTGEPDEATKTMAEWNTAKSIALPPTTTLEQDRKAAGQRSINRVWEFTQASIAILVVVAVLYAVVFIRELATAQLVFLTGSFSLVIGFYFGRTNHSRQGGIGGERESSPR